MWLRNIHLNIKGRFFPVQFVFRRFLKKNIISTGQSVAGQTMTVVDIGCGVAPYRQLFDTDNNFSYVGIDVEPRSADIQQGSAYSLPIAESSADIAIMSDVLQHLENPTQALMEARRVLKQDGLIVVSAPFLYSECDYQDFTRWTRMGLETMMKNSGFKPLIIQCRGGPIFFLFCLMWQQFQEILAPSKSGWRRKNNLLTRMATFTTLIIGSPLLVFGHVGLLVDQLFFRNPTIYMGTIILAQKNAVNRG